MSTLSCGHERCRESSEGKRHRASGLFGDRLNLTLGVTLLIDGYEREGSHTI